MYLFSQLGALSISLVCELTAPSCLKHHACLYFVANTMEHSELVAEMAHVEHLTTQERLHLARKRRIQQLKVWASREKDWLRHQRKGRSTANKKQKHIFFSDSVMLLEAAARNDIEEGEVISLSSPYNRTYFTVSNLILHHYYVFS